VKILSNFLKSGSTESKPSFLALIESETNRSINPLILYERGKYARRINVNIRTNLSMPKPIITAEKVPPKTINSDDRINRIWNDPPSKKNAPKIETTPMSSPNIVPNLFIIRNHK